MIQKFTLMGIVCLGCLSPAIAQKMSLNSTSQTAWVTVPADVKPVKENVLIRKGHRITIDSDVSCNYLTIEKAGSLISGSQSAESKLYILRPGVASDSVIIANDGLIGDLSNALRGFALLVPGNSKHLTIKGNGQTSINSIAPVPEGNGSLIIDIEKDIVLNAKGIALSAFGTKKVNINIAKNKTVKIINSNGILQSGKGTYNIYGTLDLINTDVQILNTDKSDNLALNIYGKLILGKGLSVVSTAESKKIKLYIASGGLVDATRCEVLSLAQNFFAVHGDGALLRLVDNREAAFPIGIEGANTANGLILKNTGRAGYFKVGLENKIAMQLPMEERIIEKQWTVLPESNTYDYDLSIVPSWTVSDQKTTLDPSENVSVIQVKGDNTQSTVALRSGRGQPSSPFTASAPGFKSGGSFTIIKNEKNTFTAYPNPAIEQVTIIHPKALPGARVRINTLYGKELSQSFTETDSKSTLINISALSKGIYIVNFDNGAKSYSVKLIKGN